jgi:rRNA maturation RNase YbeY
MLYAAESLYDVTIYKLVYSFISKDQMLKLNIKFLNHNTDTDIISFCYGAGKVINSEVYLSISQIIENANENSQTLENETVRVLSHGFLHSIGFNDKSNEEKKVMIMEENKMIDMFHVEQ